MLLVLGHLAILVNGTLIGFLLTAATDQATLLCALCSLEVILFCFVIIRHTTQKRSAAARKHVHRLASLTYHKMEVYYKKTLNNAMCASCKLPLLSPRLFFGSWQKCSLCSLCRPFSSSALPNFRLLSRTMRRVREPHLKAR